MEIYDNDGAVVSSRSALDMVGRSFRVGLRQFPGGARVTKRGRRASRGFGANRATHPAKVPKEIIDQTTAFTQPRGRLEMGGLLIITWTTKATTSLFVGSSCVRRSLVWLL